MKVAGRALATMIAMVAILLIAVGADKVLQYLEQSKYERQCREQYVQNQAQAEQLRTQIEELSQDEAAVETFLQEHAVDDPEDGDEDVLQEFLTASTRDNGSGENASEKSASDRESVSEDMLSGEDQVADVSENDGVTVVSGDDISDNHISNRDFSGHTISGNAVSGNGIFDNTISGNGVSGNEISGNSVSGGGISLTTVSGNILVRPTLRERRLGQSSYMETIEWNEADREVIGQSTRDFSDIKIACLGDSITQAANLENMEDYQQYSYPTKLAEVLGAKEVVNLGIGGSSLGRYWQDAFVERYMEIPEDTDLILVMGGTNDGFCLHKENVGNFEERSPHTLIGDLDELMRGLKENYPDTEVIFLTPLPNVLHDILRKERPELMSQRVIVDSMIALAKEYELDVIDLYDSNLLDSHDAAVISNYMPDGVHCNPDGYQILAEHIAADLIRLQDLPDEEEGEALGEAEEIEMEAASEQGMEGESGFNQDMESVEDSKKITDLEPAEESRSQIPPDILRFRERDTAQTRDSMDREARKTKEEDAADKQIWQDMKIEVDICGQ